MGAYKNDTEKIGVNNKARVHYVDSFGVAVALEFRRLYAGFPFSKSAVRNGVMRKKCGPRFRDRIP